MSLYYFFPVWKPQIVLNYFFFATQYTCAPLSRSNLATSTCPSMEASISAVCISSVLCSWSAPASNRNLTMSRWPAQWMKKQFSWGWMQSVFIYSFIFFIYLYFYSRDTFYDFLFVYLCTKPLPKMGLYLKQCICSFRTKFPSFRSESNWQGWQKYFL